MKKFLVKLSIYLFFLLIFILVAGQGLYLCTQFFYEKGKYLREEPHIMIVGDSQFETGLNPHFIDHSFNCSRRALQYKYALAKLKYYTEQNDFKVALVSLGYHSLMIQEETNNSVLQRESTEQELNYNMPLIVNDSQLYDSFDSIKHTKVFIEQFLLYRLGIPTKTIINDLIYNIKNIKSPSIKSVRDGFLYITDNNVTREVFEKRFEDVLDYLSPDKKVEVKPNMVNINYAREIIDFCKSKQMKIVFVNTPLHSDILPLFQHVIASTDSIANEWAKDPDIYYLNYSHIYFPDWGFKDHNHLNAHGAETFSRQLNDTLKSLYLE